jgi:5-methylcytosine-specific restriction enzyme subunit McrC
MSAEAGRGRHSVASFVVNMAKVFEDFVTTSLREALDGYPGETSGQYETFLDEAEAGQMGNRVRMAVDIVHSVRGAPAMVFDAKYKAASAADGYTNADYYQMLAYCTALTVPTAWLIYAGPGQPRVRGIRNSEVSVVEYPIDLSQSPEDLLARVQKLSVAAFETWRVSQRNTSLSAS